MDGELERDGRLRFARGVADIVPLRTRPAPPRSPDDLRGRADRLVDRFVAVVEEAADLPCRRLGRVRVRRPATPVQGANGHSVESPTRRARVPW